MKVLVTGSSGQIGTNLALRLQADGHDVFGIDKRQNTWLDGDEFRYLLQDLSGHYPASKQKAELLLKDQLPCLGCHKLKGDGGTIGPDLTTVRERRSRAYIAAMISDPQRVVPGSAMPRILMTESTRRLIVQYLGELPGSATDDGAAASRPATADAGNRAATQATPNGPALYARLCASCHGAGGKGDGANASNLPVKPAVHSSGDAMSARPDDSLFDTIASGGAVMNRSPRMPAFGGTLSAAEIRALVRHIRTLCGCEGPTWSRNP